MVGKAKAMAKKPLQCQTAAATRDTKNSQGISFVDNRGSTIRQRKLIEGLKKTVQPQSLQRRPADDEAIQGKLSSPSTSAQLQSIKPSPENKTGMPDSLKSGVEALSGMDMSDVRVYKNSNKPAQLNALAYAQGNDIHLGAGHEQHLAHEAWHVVQQRQGRVKPTTQMAGVQVNDDVSLEKEADAMGAKAITQAKADSASPKVTHSGTDAYNHSSGATIQGYFLFPGSNEHVTTVPKLYRIEGSISLNQTLKGWAADKTERKYYNWNDAIDEAVELAHAYSGYEPPVESDTQTIDVDLKKVKANTGTSDVELKPINEKDGKQTAEAESKRGYIGTAIVWTGETDAAGLANNYVKKSNDWEASERKARLAVNFGINNRAEFEKSHNRKAESAVTKTVNDCFGSTSASATTHVNGWTWGYKYNKGKLPKSTTGQVATYIDEGKIGGKKVVWKYGEAELTSRLQVLDKFNKIRGEAGVPYGALRSQTGKNTQPLEEHLTGTNHTGTVYVHSIDADAPDFSTLKEGEDEGSWKKVLDAYDEILDAQDHDVVIGGYNLLANPEAYSGKDYLHTVRSNLVDLAIRQAVHAVEPLMTYPTEPNFIIKATEYRKSDDESGSSNVWGSGAYEGRNFIDNYIKAKASELGTPDIHYDPLASVPTGVGGGGARLKIETDKEYDKDSLYGRPQADDTSDVGDKISIEDQYVVQAQSWSGASRIATAYRSAYEAKSNRAFPSKKKGDSIQAFSHIEQMVKALVDSSTSVGDCSWDVSVFDSTYKTDCLIKVDDILKRIKARLIQLESDPDFGELIEL
ncbi:DUF4157 domain-containing protein [Pseudomonadota bacterium]